MIKYHIIKKDKNYSANKGIATLSLLLCFALAGSFLVYLIQINSLVDCSYRIKDYQNKISQLKERQINLEMQVTQLRSPVNLYRQVDSLQMTEAENIVYLGDKKSVAIND